MIPPSETDGFDLTPEPRILPMLGEISLAPWRCIAELIDNSIDGFLSAAGRGITPIDPEFHVSLPARTEGNPRVTVRDNGPGMTPDTLEKAVRAGWTGNEPIGRLGMFGMGFNIATARLGTRTQVWTTREGDQEWHGLTIDFQTLMSQGHFRTPRSTRPKGDSRERGTEISIERLKPETALTFSKASNRSRITRELAKVYSSMLQANGTPLNFRLTVNNNRVRGREHCVWGDGELQRIVVTPRHGAVSALQDVDVDLGERTFCSACWQWLPFEQLTCPSCGSSDAVVQRPRRISGWLGVQRYLSAVDFGIDLIRHGRKIELANKDLFLWDNEGVPEPEYPIDDPRYRGRIVGEIHLDHARVTYTKDRFDRNDPAWEEMVTAIRGEGPLRPDKAQQLGYGINTSPLSLLFQAFRRSNPQRRVAGGYTRLLVVPDNSRAEEMARRFYSRDPVYQSDAKWYELAEEADRRLLTDSTEGASTTDAPDLEGFTTPPDSTPDCEIDPSQDSPSHTRAHPQRVTLPAITREYTSESTALRWNVESFQLSPDDPELGGDDQPWKLVATSQGDYRFLVNVQHPVFQSATMTPLDALLAQLAWVALDFLRGQQASNATFAAVLAELRDRYAMTSRLEPAALSVAAAATLTEIGRCLQRNIDDDDGAVLFTELSPTDQDEVQHRMAARMVPNPQSAIAQGGFLEYAPFRTLLSFFQKHPELFLDGRYWETSYESLDYGTNSATDEARARIIHYYLGLLSDAVWLAEQHPSDLSQASRERLLRTSLALDLLAPSVDID